MWPSALRQLFCLTALLPSGSLPRAFGLLLLSRAPVCLSGSWHVFLRMCVIMFACSRLLKVSLETRGRRDKELRRLAKGNDLEAHVYEVRSWLNGKDRNLLNPTVIEPILDETIMWYEDSQHEEGTTYEMYDDRLTGLKRKLEEHCADYFEKKRKDKADLEASMEKAAQEERQRRHDLGMDADKDDRKMSKSERLRMASKNKDEGNEVFKVFDVAPQRTGGASALDEKISPHNLNLCSGRYRPFF